VGRVGVAYGLDLLLHEVGHEFERVDTAFQRRDARAPCSRRNR
jgi:hypothetical protein